MSRLYWYRAEILSVYDGDTVRAAFSLGFGIRTSGEAGKGVKLRLYGINTSEMRGGTDETKARAREARDWLSHRVLGKEVLVHTLRDTTGKYGRYLAELYELDSEGNELEPSLNQQLVDAGLAEEYMRD